MTDEESGDNVISLEKIKNELGFGTQSCLKASDGNDADDDDNDDDDSNLNPKCIPQTSTVYLQKPFQPCSTPVHLQRRFMVIIFKYLTT